MNTAPDKGMVIRAIRTVDAATEKEHRETLVEWLILLYPTKDIQNS